MEWIITILISSILAICPGAWVSFTLPNTGLNFNVRLALAISATPLLLSVQLIILKIFGINFTTASIVLVLINSLSLILILRKITSLQWSRKILLPLSLLIILTLSLIVIWVAVPNLLEFSWHALMHTDIVNQWTRSGFPLEEPELSGLSLAYPWMGHAYWAVAGWLTDQPPIYIYPISNIIWMVATFILAHELMRNVFKISSSSSMIGLAIMFLGTNIAGATVWLLAGSRGYLQWVTGDPRYTPLLGKYQGFEAMPFAFALVTAIALINSLNLAYKYKGYEVLNGILLLGIGIIYPTLFPISFVIIIIAVSIRYFGYLTTHKSFKIPREIIITSIITVICAVITFGYILLITQGQPSSRIQIAHSGRISKIIQTGVALLPMVLLASPYLLRSKNFRHKPTILLSLSGLFCLAIYILTDMTNHEYKYILVATILLSPLSAAGIENLTTNHKTLRKFILPVVPLILIAFHGILALRSGVGPDNLSNAPQINTTSFLISLDDSESDSNWINAIRQNTPDETIVIADQTKIHISPFLTRALYFPSDLDGELSAGYSLNNYTNLVQIRGYSENLYAERDTIVDRLYNSNDPNELNSLIDKIAGLNRPIAIVLPNDSAGYQYFENYENGEKIYQDQNLTTWFIEANIHKDQ